MTIRIIMVPLDGSDAARPALELALVTAKRTGAHLEALHVRADPKDAVPLLGEGMSGAMIEELIDLTEKEAEARCERARSMFDTLCAENGVTVTDGPGSAGPTAGWRETTGREDELAAWRGRLADLIVVGRPAADSEAPSILMVNAAVFESGRPVLVAPPTFAPDLGRRVAIAWNGSAEAARAVHGALPLIASAESVTIFTTETEKTPETAAGELSGYLAGHGISAEQRSLTESDGPVAKALLEACVTDDVDLLVMGAYTHSRLRQLILGGVTRHVLQEVTLPVLMAH